jgi:hypothetical protein
VIAALVLPGWRLLVNVGDAARGSATRRLSSRYLPPNRGHPSPRLVGKSMNDRTRAIRSRKKTEIPRNVARDGCPLRLRVALNDKKCRTSRHF